MIILIIFLGLIVGSFLNAAIHRLHSGQSILADRSRCVHCDHELSAVDLVPIFSFILLRGRCRYCHKPISWQYPLVELATAVIFVLFALNNGLRITDYGLWFGFVFSGILIIIGVFDFKHFLILDKIVYPALALALVRSLFLQTLPDALFGAAITAGFFALQYYVSKGRWIGFGDVKLGLFLGALLGVKLAVAMLMLAYLLGALVGLGLIASGRKQLSSKLPFGSFLAVSAIIIMLYGEGIVGWYFRLLGL